MNLVLISIWKIFNKDKRRKEVAIGKVVAQLCLTLIVKEFKIIVEQDRVVTSQNISEKINIIFSVVDGQPKRVLSLKTM